MNDFTRRWVQIEMPIKPASASFHGELLLKYVSPVIRKLEQQGQIDLFHFLYEPGPRFLLRVHLCVQVKKSKVEQLLLVEANKIAKRLLSSNPYIQKHYDGDIKSFGTKQQPFVVKYLDICSRLAILDAKNPRVRGKDFSRFKLVHLFLNEWGNNIADEAVFHCQALQERIQVLVSQ